MKTLNDENIFTWINNNKISIDGVKFFETCAEKIIKEYPSVYNLYNNIKASNIIKLPDDLQPALIYVCLGHIYSCNTEVEEWDMLGLFNDFDDAVSTTIKFFEYYLFNISCINAIKSKQKFNSALNDSHYRVDRYIIWSKNDSGAAEMLFSVYKPDTNSYSSPAVEFKFLFKSFMDWLIDIDRVRTEEGLLNKKFNLVIMNRADKLADWEQAEIYQNMDFSSLTKSFIGSTLDRVNKM